MKEEKTWEEVKNEFNEIMLDEYQDTSYIRYLLLKEIINKEYHLPLFTR